MHYIPINQTHLVIFGVTNPTSFSALPCYLQSFECKAFGLKVHSEVVVELEWWNANDTKHSGLKRRIEKLRIYLDAKTWVT
jgi:hypothetical protein